MERILILGDINSPHTQKWIDGLLGAGFVVGVFSLQPLKNKSDINEKIMLFQKMNISGNRNSFTKINYLKSIPYLKRIVYYFKPDLIHAHYASSYGLLGAVLNFKPYIISAWGSDIYDFPRYSLLHKLVLKFSLSRAQRILSTSNTMITEIKKYSNTELTVIPFGINLDRFKKAEILFQASEKEIVIGTIKALEPTYGIEYLIRAFKIIKGRHPILPLKLLIVGEGSEEHRLKALCTSLDIAGEVIFTGKIAQDQIHIYHNMLSIFVSLSIYESFGVSTLEAAACERPVVVSAVDGSKEIVLHTQTGFIVPVRNAEAAADSIEKLIFDKELCEQMGVAGRRRVEQLYNWNSSINHLVHVYKTIKSNVRKLKIQHIER